MDNFARQRYESARFLQRKLAEEIERQCAKFSVISEALKYSVEDVDLEIAEEEQNRPSGTVEVRFCCGHVSRFVLTLLIINRNPCPFQLQLMMTHRQ